MLNIRPDRTNAVMRVITVRGIAEAEPVIQMLYQGTLLAIPILIAPK